MRYKFVNTGKKKGVVTKGGIARADLDRLDRLFLS